MLGLLRRVLGRGHATRCDAAPAEPSSRVPDYCFRFLAEQSLDVICRVGADKRIKYITPSCHVLYGQTPEEMLDQLPEGHVLADDLPIVFACIARTEAGDMTNDSATYRIRRPDGGIRWVETNVRIVRNEQTHDVQDRILVTRDITERKELEERLAAMARTDGLTDLVNRRAFDEALENEWRRTRRAGTQLSLLLLDIDHFKRFNDRYGHQAGDDCLRAVAMAVRDAIRRPGDTAARYGGEEIAVILPGTDAQGAKAVAETVRQVVEALQIPHQDNAAGGHHVTVSIGSATARACAGGSVDMPEGLLLGADTALYKAKNAGRNRIEPALLLMSQAQGAAQ